MSSEIGVVSWNLLADCYSTEYSNRWEIRKHKIENLVKKFSSHADIFLLQEIDHCDDFYVPLFTSLGYNCIYAQRPRKDDGCMICFRSSKYIEKAKEFIYFDDLAKYSNQSECINSSLIRQNVGIVIQLECIEEEYFSSHLQFITAVAHLYWNPAFPDIKEAQAEYYISRVELFNQKHSSPIAETHTGSTRCPVFIAGDFNSTPDSDAYKVLTSHVSVVTRTGDYKRDIIEMCSRIVSKRFCEHKSLYGEETKFLCDHDLSRLCRWLRLLGVDAAMELHPKIVTKVTRRKALVEGDTAGGKDSVGPEVGVSVDFSPIFDRARREGRIILTTSKTMRERAACPHSMLIATQNMEKSLSDIFRVFKIPVKREKVLTVCGKCGGNIVEVTCDEFREANKKYQAELLETGLTNLTIEKSEKWLPSDRPIYMCVKCTQVMNSCIMFTYWTTNLRTR